MLSHTVGTDPQLAFFTSQYDLAPVQQTLFLQTSPEFAMKRLLAAGCGSIYQICKAFRNGETGRYHNPEFTLLEWYRVGFNLTDLMEEIGELFEFVFEQFKRPMPNIRRISYQALFLQHTGIDPLYFDLGAYQAYARAGGILDAIAICGESHNLWLDFLFSHKIQPALAENCLYMVYHYPACQAALARITTDNPLVCERVELFFNGLELGNGFYELADAKEQGRRFDQDIAFRQQQHLPPSTKDLRLLAALETGLPDCSGMAIGLDRLLMVLSQQQVIAEVLAFAIGRA